MDWHVASLRVLSGRNGATPQQMHRCEVRTGVINRLRQQNAIKPQLGYRIARVTINPPISRVLIALVIAPAKPTT